MELSKRVARRIRNMESHVHFDLEKGIATVPLYYETPDDLLDEHLSRPGKPVISDDAIDYLLDIVKDIPKEFTVDFSLTVNDYGAYDPHQLLKAIQVTVENTYYYYDENRKKDIALSVLFIVIGALSMIIEFIGLHYKWYGPKDAISTDIITSLFDLVTWIFFWEGAAILFLTYENDATVFHHDLGRFQGIRFVDDAGGVLSATDRDKLYRNWVRVEKRELFARHFILFSYPVLFAVTAVEIGEFGQQIAGMDGWSIARLLFGVITVVLLAIANVSFFRGKGPLKKWVIPLSLVLLGYAVINMIESMIHGEIRTISFYLNCFAMILILINVICLRYMQKQTVETCRKRGKSDNGDQQTDPPTDGKHQ